MIRKTTMALACAALGGSLLAAPASAAPVSITAYSDCPAGRLCVWTGLGGTGAIGIFRTGDANLGDSVGPRGLNNTIESAWNRTGSDWCFYDGANYSGAFLGPTTPGSRGNLKTEYRNRITSLEVCT